MNLPDVTNDELQQARLWWQQLADNHKGHQSIWALLALYEKSERQRREREAQRREDFGPNGDATTPGFFK